MTFPLEYQQFKANYDDPIGCFDRMGLSPRLIEALKTRTPDPPTIVQQQAIVPILRGRNVMVKSQAGTGRMLSFVIAALQKVDLRNDECQVLILTPDRTVALQALQLLKDLGDSLGIGCQVCLEDEEGESGLEPRMSTRRTTTHIIVATPALLLSRLQTGGLSSSSIDLLVVADLDIMLHKQLGNTLESIFQLLTPSSSRSVPKLQVALYFDLQTPDLVRLADQLTLTQQNQQQQHVDDDGTKVTKIFVRKVPLTLDRVRHYFVDVETDVWKFETLCDLYEVLQIPQMVVFCNSRESQDVLVSSLRAPTSPLVDIPVSSIHPDLTPTELATAMQAYRRGDTRLLIVSTPFTLVNVDVAQVPFLVGYDFPLDQEVYLRRCGSRPSRFGRRSVCVSFLCGERERALMRSVEAGLDDEIPEMPMNIADLI